MGGTIGKETAMSRKIDTALKQLKMEEDSKIKLLLLGAGESGKSTLFKQIKLLYKEKDFKKDERKNYQQVVHSNIISDFQFVLKACQMKGMELDEVTLEAQKKLDSWDRRHPITEEDGDMLSAVWRTEAVQACWNDRSDIQVQDALEYYMQDEIFARVAKGKAYLPSNNDIIRSRVRTSGVAIEKFHMGQATFEMYDVGGQRNERRKWIHSFDNVTSVVFVAAISEYDQVLFEDNSVNRQQEAVELFKKCLHEKWFENVPFILFLNKKDLFREKLGRIPFRIDDGPRARNLDYDGPVCDPTVEYKVDGTDKNFEEMYELTCDYLQNLYEKQQEGRTKPTNIYTYIINSTDTENIGRIMGVCKDIILKENLKRFGWFFEDGKVGGVTSDQ